MDKMKNGCIVCNMGHSNTEIDVVRSNTTLTRQTWRTVVASKRINILIKYEGGVYMKVALLKCDMSSC